MGKSNVEAAAYIAHTFGGAAKAQPTQWWVSLYSSNPGAAVTASSPTPLNANRAQITGWTRNNQSASNTNAITFEAVPVGQTWNVTHICIFTAQTGGQPISFGPLEVAKTVSAGDVFTIGATRLTLTES